MLEHCRPGDHHCRSTDHLGLGRGNPAIGGPPGSTAANASVVRYFRDDGRTMGSRGWRFCKLCRLSSAPCLQRGVGADLNSRASGERLPAPAPPARQSALGALLRGIQGFGRYCRLSVDPGPPDLITEARAGRATGRVESVKFLDPRRSVVVALGRAESHGGAGSIQQADLVPRDRDTDPVGAEALDERLIELALGGDDVDHTDPRVHRDPDA